MNIFVFQLLFERYVIVDWEWFRHEKLLKPLPINYHFLLHTENSSLKNHRWTRNACRFCDSSKRLVHFTKWFKIWPVSCTNSTYIFFLFPRCLFPGQHFCFEIYSSIPPGLYYLQRRDYQMFYVSGHPFWALSMYFKRIDRKKSIITTMKPCNAYVVPRYLQHDIRQSFMKNPCLTYV